jgi:hypothetical protein
VALFFLLFSVIWCCTCSEIGVAVLRVTRDMVDSEYFQKVVGCCHSVFWMADEYYLGW